MGATAMTATEQTRTERLVKRIGLSVAPLGVGIGAAYAVLADPFTGLNLAILSLTTGVMALIALRAKELERQSFGNV